MIILDQFLLFIIYYLENIFLKEIGQEQKIYQKLMNLFNKVFGVMFLIVKFYQDGELFFLKQFILKFKNVFQNVLMMDIIIQKNDLFFRIGLMFQRVLLMIQYSVKELIFIGIVKFMVNVIGVKEKKNQRLIYFLILKYNIFLKNCFKIKSGKKLIQKLNILC